MTTEKKRRQNINKTIGRGIIQLQEENKKLREEIESEKRLTNIVHKELRDEIKQLKEKIENILNKVSSLPYGEQSRYFKSRGDKELLLEELNKAQP